MLKTSYPYVLLPGLQDTKSATYLACLHSYLLVRFKMSVDLSAAEISAFKVYLKAQEEGA